MEYCFSLTTNQLQPAYQPQPSAEHLKETRGRETVTNELKPETARGHKIMVSCVIFSDGKRL